MRIAVVDMTSEGINLGALADDGQGAMSPLQTQRVDLSSDGFKHAQAVEGEQADQRVVGGAPRPAVTSIAPTSLRSNPVAWDS